jgi:hypothetical protein
VRVGGVGLGDEQVEAAGAQGRAARSGLGLSDVDGDARRGRRQRDGGRRDDVPHRGGERAHHDGPADLAGERGQVVLGGGEHVGEPGGVPGQQPAGGGEPDRPPAAQAGPVEQGHAGLGLQPGDVLGDRRRRQVQDGRGGEHPTRVGHRAEDHEPARVDSHSVTLHAV